VSRQGLPVSRFGADDWEDLEKYIEAELAKPAEQKGAAL